MSEPIIIETPAPPTRERIVLVRERVIVPESRDATPDDLERGGYVPVLHGAASWKVAHADACRELDEQRARAEKADLYSLEETARANKAERERDEASRRAREACQAAVACAGADGPCDVGEAVARLVARHEALRAELARLTAPAEGTNEATEAQYREQSDFDAGVAHERARLAAAGVTVATAEDAARFEVAQGRATDEELGRVFGDAYTMDESPDHGVSLRTAYLAVAAHVRKECLVAQAVGMGDLSIARVPGESGRHVTLTTPDGNVRRRYAEPASDVPATLARLLGEVGK